MNLIELHTKLVAAKTVEDVFGKDDISKLFRVYIKICHPDLNQDNPSIADETLKLLTRWRDIAEGKVEPAPVVSYSPITISVRGKDYSFVSLLGNGQVSTVHRIASKDKFLFAKVSNHHNNNDLLEAEYNNLDILSKSSSQNEFTKTWSNYIPKPVSSFQIKNSSGSMRRASIFEIPLDNDMLTLKQLSEHPKFKDGIDRKHLYWMLRRILLTLQFAHDCGIEHGLSNPDHWLIYPKQHGIILLDWTNSFSKGRKLSYIDPDWKDYYRSYKTSSNLDVQLAVFTFLQYAIGLPPKMDRVIRTLLDKAPTAAQAHFEIGQLIDKYDGPRVFTPLEV